MIYSLFDEPISTDFKQPGDLLRYLVSAELVFPTVRTFLGSRRYGSAAVATFHYHFWPATGKETSEDCADSHPLSGYR